MRAGSAHRPGRRRNRAALLVLACGLAGCGGGGGTGKAWSVPERISFANGNVGAPEIAVDTSGIATAAYQDHDGTDWVIAASRYTPGNSWGSPQGISTTPSTSAIGNDVDVAAGPTGEAVVVWTQKPDSLTFDSAWANSWTPGGGWGMPQLLDSTARLVDAPRVALDASGAGTAVWVEAAPVPDTDDILRGRPYAPGAGWGSQFSIPLMQPTRIQSPPVIAAQPDGRTYVAWSQTFNSGISLFASWSDDRPPSTWHTEFADTLSPPALSPDLAVNVSGTAFLVWDQTFVAGTPTLVFARRRRDSNMADAWESPLPLSVNNGGDAQFARVAVDDAGNAIVVWEQLDSGAPSAVRSIWGSRFLVVGGWGAAQRLETADGEARLPRVAMTPGGEAFAVWTQEEGGHPRVWAAHFLLASGWEAPVRLENDAGKDAFGPTVAVDGSGNAFAVWGLSDPALSGVSKIWASQYR